MKIEVFALPIGKVAHVDPLVGRNTHALQRGSMCNWRDHNFAQVLEADEATVKQAIDGSREQKAIFAV